MATLQNLNDLIGFRLFGAGDEAVGVLVDLLFDERTSRTRYLLIESEAWLPSSVILIAPGALETVDLDRSRLTTGLGREALERGPVVERPTAPAPDEEARLQAYYKWPQPWAGAEIAELIPYWGAAGAEPAAASEAETPGLRIARQVIGFGIRASDGAIGHVEDLVLDVQSWTIRYLVVDIGAWLPGQRVLVSPQWLTRIDWAERSVAVDLTRERVRSSPPYDRSAALDRRFEQMLHRHVARAGYW